MTAPSQRPARQTPVGSAGQACIGPKSPFTGTEWTPPLDARLAQSGTVLSVEASRLDRATDRCSCKRSPCTAHSQTGVVANVHHARRTARPVELQTFTMHGAQPDRWACHVHPVSRTAIPVVLSSDHRPEVNTRRRRPAGRRSRSLQPGRRGDGPQKGGAGGQHHTPSER